MIDFPNSGYVLPIPEISNLCDVLSSLSMPIDIEYIIEAKDYCI